MLNKLEARGCLSQATTYIIYFACCSDSVLIGLAATNSIVCHRISDHWFVWVRAFKYGDPHTIQGSSTKLNSNSFFKLDSFIQYIIIYAKIIYLPFYIEER